MSQDADELLRKAKGAARPTAADLARVRRALDAKIAAAAVVAGATAAVKMAATGTVAPKVVAATGASLVAKVIGVVAVAGVAAGGYVVAQKTRTPEAPAQVAPATSAPSAAQVAPARVRPSSPPVPSPTVSASAGPLATGAALQVTPVRSAQPSAVALPLATPRPPPPPATATVSAPAPVFTEPPPAPPLAPPPPPAVPAERLAEEVALLRRIDAALARGDGAAALAGVDEHARVFPSGALVPEREAARVLALCAAGRRDEAAHQAASFRARYPRSPSLPRIDASCAGAP